MIIFFFVKCVNPELDFKEGSIDIKVAWEGNKRIDNFFEKLASTSNILHG